MSIMAKLARVAKPGMFTAVLVGVAITAAATYTSKLAMEYDRALDEVEAAKSELAGIEAHRASIIMEIQDLQTNGQEMFNQLRIAVASEVMAQMREDILGGAYDDAVNARAMELSGQRVKASDNVDTEQ